MCLFFITLFAGPRVGILFWWLVNPSRWSAAFDTFIWPALGFVFLPWTTLMFVAVAPLGSVVGWDWAWLALSFMADVTTYTTGGWSNRGRLGYA
jgi:hypothetical protein